MSKLHEEIANKLSPEARRALVNTREDQPVAIERGPLTDVVRQELRTADLIDPGFDLLTIRGECVREYVLEAMLP